MSNSWHDINDPGAFVKKTAPAPASRPTQAEPEPARQTEPEVKLSDPQFIKGADGFQFNKKCFVQVKVDYLKQTSKKKVTYDLFVECDGEEENLNCQTNGFEKDGYAKAEVTLFYGNNYHEKLTGDKMKKCNYIFRASHSTVKTKLQSDPLEMPHEEKSRVDFLEMPDCHFNHNSAVPCIDKNGDFIGTMVAALVYAKDNPDKELLICGHTDTSGKEAYNQELSELRAKAIKAFLDNDKSAFVNIATQKSKVEDYQGILSVLFATHAWSCDPGAVDNQDGPKTQTALKDFQAEYNAVYEKTLAVDGKIGNQTWEAFFNVIRDMIRAIVSNEYPDGQIPRPKYDQQGAIGYGETRPIEQKSKNSYKSKTNRRVELMFKDPGQKTDDPRTFVMEPIEVKAPPPAAITGIVLNCKHRTDNKYKGTKKKYLAVVPNPNDTISLEAETKQTDSKITWKISGIKKEDLTGKSVSLQLNGFKSQATNIIPAFLNEGFLKILPPKRIQAKAVDESQKAVAGIVEVFPFNTVVQELKIPTGLKGIKELSEKINKTLKSKFDQRLDFKLLEGKVTVTVNWAEDEGCEQAYPAFEIKGGFLPLIGIEWTGKIQLIGVMNAIPSSVRKYIADIAAFLTVSGALDLTLSFARISVNRVSGKGTAGGTIGLAVGLMAEIGNGKILVLKAQLSSSIGAELNMECKKETNDSKKWGIFGSLDGKFGAVKGTISFEVFDGAYARNEEIILMKEEKYPIFKEKPLFGSETSEDQNE